MPCDDGKADVARNRRTQQTHTDVHTPEGGTGDPVAPANNTNMHTNTAVRHSTQHTAADAPAYTPLYRAKREASIVTRTRDFESDLLPFGTDLSNFATFLGACFSALCKTGVDIFRGLVGLFVSNCPSSVGLPQKVFSAGPWTPAMAFCVHDDAVVRVFRRSVTCDTLYVLSRSFAPTPALLCRSSLFSALRSRCLLVKYSLYRPDLPSRTTSTAVVPLLLSFPQDCVHCAACLCCFYVHNVTAHSPCAFYLFLVCFSSLREQHRARRRCIKMAHATRAVNRPYYFRYRGDQARTAQDLLEQFDQHSNPPSADVSAVNDAPAAGPQVSVVVDDVGRTADCRGTATRCSTDTYCIG